ncbi:nicotinamide mononucleotide transporter family protein [Sporomusa sphaeroides DSM 2875]|nr:nicotinamide mononucleotide transporter family protein [Sporomusa sphaeroides DSM 2875]
MEYLAWIVTVAALFGTWLNIKKDQRCFWIWIATNAFWCAYDAWHELYAQAFLFSLYLFLAIIGALKWRE